MVGPVLHLYFRDGERRFLFGVVINKQRVIIWISLSLLLQSLIKTDMNQVATSPLIFLFIF